MLGHQLSDLRETYSEEQNQHQTVPASPGLHPATDAYSARAAHDPSPTTAGPAGVQ